MRIAHIADLHLGKKLKGFSLIEDQFYILQQILEVLKKEKVEVLMICGDVYDHSVASGDSVDLLDVFLTDLSKLDITVLLISGNHDHPQRLAFGSKLLEKSNIYIHTDTSESFKPMEVNIKDVSFFLLPFFRPVEIQRVTGEGLTFTEAWKKVLDSIAKRDKRIILAHQFVTHQQFALESESEMLSVGTLDNIEAVLFDAFDYVALGHLHRPQFLKREAVRYSGSPLKFSLSESQDNKSITLIDTDGMNITTVPLTPLRDVRKIQGPLENLLQSSFASEDYIHAVLTDPFPPVDAMSDLREIYPNTISLEYSGGHKSTVYKMSNRRSKDPLEMTEDFYLLQLEKEMDSKSKAIVESVMKEIR